MIFYCDEYCKITVTEETNIVQIYFQENSRKLIIEQKKFRELRLRLRDLHLRRDVGRLVRLHRGLLRPPVAPVGADVAPGLNFMTTVTKQIDHFKSAQLL